MKNFFSKIAAIILTSLIIIGFYNPDSFANTIKIKNNFASAQPVVNGKSAVLINAETGQILYQKNAFLKGYPASTTKIITALLAIEKLKPDEVVTVSKTACQLDPDSSTAGIVPGEKLTVKELLYCLLLDSANESANALAEKISGNIPSFVKLMNKRVKELGGKNSNFVTTNGLHRPNHYTTPYDLSRVAMQCMKYPLFRQIVKTDIYHTQPTNKHPKGIYLSNTDKLINKYKGSRYLYPYALGIKTGYTSQALHTFVSAAKKGNLELISVVFYSQDAFQDTLKILNYGFNNFKVVNLIKGNLTVKRVKIYNGDKDLALKTASDLNYTFRNNETGKPTSKIDIKADIKAPIVKGQVVGSMRFFLNHKQFAEGTLVAGNNVDEASLLKKIQNKSKHINLIQIVSAAVVIIVLLLVSLNILRKRKNNGMFSK